MTCIFHLPCVSFARSGCHFYVSTTVALSFLRRRSPHASICLPLSFFTFFGGVMESSDKRSKLLHVPKLLATPTVVTDSRLGSLSSLTLRCRQLVGVVSYLFGKHSSNHYIIDFYYCRTLNQINFSILYYCRHFSLHIVLSLHWPKLGPWSLVLPAGHDLCEHGRSKIDRRTRR